MKTSLRWALGFLLAAVWGLALAGVDPGQSAPDFSLKDAAGKVWKLSELKGKIVVLEWTNPGCPFVHKHYETGNMQKIQKEAKGEGVVWLTINSSSDGKQGNMTAKEVAPYVKKVGSQAAAYLLDPDGKVGKLYGATNTPDMFVIAQDGKLAYSGAIDDKPTFRKESVKGADNYVRDAIAALLAGQKPNPSQTKPYGCSVKY